MQTNYYTRISAADGRKHTLTARADGSVLVETFAKEDAKGRRTRCRSKTAEYGPEKRGAAFRDWLYR